MKRPIIFFILFLLCCSTNSWANKCLWVDSYHEGNAWSDGIEKGIRKALDGKCELKIFRMNTKLNKTTFFSKQQGEQAQSAIDRFQPDIVIASDDNASKYLVVPYFKDNTLPFVVCGIDWTKKKYGYPFLNVTGIIEVPPVKQLLTETKQIINKQQGRALYLSTKTKTAEVDEKELRAHFEQAGFSLVTKYIRSMDEWKSGLSRGQAYDLIIMETIQGIHGWNEEEMASFVLNNNKVLTVGFDSSFIPYAMMIFAKNPEESGWWSGLAALEILNGTNPADIPMSTTNQWHLYLNSELLEKAGFTVRDELLKKAGKLRKN